MSILSSIASVASSVVGSVTNPWRWVAIGLGSILLLLVLVGGAYLRGHSAGYEEADTLRRAEVAELQSAHTRALAEAEAEARFRLQAEATRAADLERQYLAARKTLAEQRRQISNQRINDASRDVAVADGCQFGPDWVRLYNEALGTGASDRGDAVPGTAACPGGAPGPPAAPGAGVLSTVSPADILAHVRDFGARSRAMEAQLNALIDWAEGLNDEEVSR